MNKATALPSTLYEVLGKITCQNLVQFFPLELVSSSGGRKNEWNDHGLKIFGFMSIHLFGPLYFEKAVSSWNEFAERQKEGSRGTSMLLSQGSCIKQLKSEYQS